MKKPYLRTIIGSSGKGCVSVILFKLNGTKDGLFEDNLFWVGQHNHFQSSYWKKNSSNINIT